jgi:hypothetical protein
MLDGTVANLVPVISMENRERKTDHYNVKLLIVKLSLLAFENSTYGPHLLWWYALIRHSHIIIAYHALAHIYAHYLLTVCRQILRDEACSNGANTSART